MNKEDIGLMVIVLIVVSFAIWFGISSIVSYETLSDDIEIRGTIESVYQEKRNFDVKVILNDGQTLLFQSTGMPNYINNAYANLKMHEGKNSIIVYKTDYWKVNHFEYVKENLKQG